MVEIEKLALKQILGINRNKIPRGPKFCKDLCVTLPIRPKYM